MSESVVNRMHDRPLLAGHKLNSRAVLRLFCFPYGGGAARAYRPWTQILPPEIDVCAIQLPGRGNRLCEPLLPKMSLAVELVGKEIVSLLDRPYAFFGHSMGAILAFEVARLLRRGVDVAAALAAVEVTRGQVPAAVSAAAVTAARTGVNSAADDSGEEFLPASDHLVRVKLGEVGELVELRQDEAVNGHEYG